MFYSANPHHVRLSPQAKPAPTIGRRCRVQARPSWSLDRHLNLHRPISYTATLANGSSLMGGFFYTRGSFHCAIFCKSHLMPVPSAGSGEMDCPDKHHMGLSKGTGKVWTLILCTITHEYCMEITVFLGSFSLFKGIMKWYCCTCSGFYGYVFPWYNQVITQCKNTRTHAMVNVLLSQWAKSLLQSLWAISSLLVHMNETWPATYVLDWHINISVSIVLHGYSRHKKYM